MSPLDDKINQHFAGLVVRDLVKTVETRSFRPTCWNTFWAQYCATNDEATIETGIDTVREILRKHYVHRNEAGLVRSTIRERGRHKVIDRISVALNDKSDAYEARVRQPRHQEGDHRLATVSSPQAAGGGCEPSPMWSICSRGQGGHAVVVASIKPIQLSHFGFDGYVEARKQFSTEWIDLIQSVGFTRRCSASATSSASWCG